MGPDAAVQASSRRGARGIAQQWHRHDRACLTAILDGALTEDFSDGSVSCGRHTLLFKPAGIVHRASFPEDCRYVHAELHGDLLGPDRTPLAPRVFTSRELSVPLARLQAEVSRREASPWVLQGLVYELLGELLRSDAAPPVPSWLAAAKRKIDSNPTRPIGIRRLSADLGLRPDRLARAFKRAYGTSVERYVTQARVQLAARWLLETDRPIAEVALELGFFDQSHFTRVFRKQVGIPPARFRRLARR